MGRIVASVTVANSSDPDKSMLCDALVDTGVSHMTLPTAWRDRLGDLKEFGVVEIEIANQQTVKGVVCGPVLVQIQGFRSIATEVLFVDMEPQNGKYEPLIGYIALEQSQAAVDMLGHRLIHVKHLDLK